MKRILIGQILLLFSISSLVCADDFPTYSIEQSLDKPKIKDGVIEIEPAQERMIGNNVIKIERKFKKFDKFKKIDLNNLRPQNPDELFRCNDINSMNIHNGPVCARQVERVVCVRAPCPWPERWISYPNPKDACAASNITEYALGNCIYKETDSDLEIFKAQARSANCSDWKNRLFLIDNELVFWEVAGNCPDGGYGLTLYDKKSHQILCSEHDSISGPRRTINNDKYRHLFESIIQNLENPNLGLSSDHKVEEVSLTD